MPVQRCRNHKIRNVLGHLPKEQHEQAKATLKAAFKIEQHARWLDREWRSCPNLAGRARRDVHDQPSGPAQQAAACLGTTNIIDNGHSAVRYRMRHIQNWQSGSMAQRWAAAVFNVTSKGVRRIMGYEHLWMLKAALVERLKTEGLLRRRLLDNLS